MEIRGSQIRSTVEEEGYRILGVGDGKAVLERIDDGQRELWGEKDDFSGFCIEIEGVGYEFIRTIPRV